MAKSLPRKVKVGFTFALGSQPFRDFIQLKWETASLLNWSVQFWCKVLEKRAWGWRNSFLQCREEESVGARGGWSQSWASHHQRDPWLVQGQSAEWQTIGGKNQIWIVEVFNLSGSGLKIGGRACLLSGGGPVRVLTCQAVPGRGLVGAHICFQASSLDLHLFTFNNLDF